MSIDETTEVMEGNIVIKDGEVRVIVDVSRQK